MLVIEGKLIEPAEAATHHSSIQQMKFLRLKLSTFLILTAVLPATFGMLYRYGQLDFRVERFYDADLFWDFTIFDYQVRVVHDGCILSRTTSWVNTGDMDFQHFPKRDTNPWSREWEPFGRKNIVSITIGATPAPSIQALEALWPK